MIRNIATVLRGTVVAQAIGILVLPLLSRTFDATAFGHFQLYQSILAVLMVFATMRYEIAILRANSPVELGAVLALCVGINLFLAAMIGIVVLILAWTAPEFLARAGFPPWLLPATMLVGGIAQYLGYLLVREGRFSTGANARIAQAVTYSATASGLAVTAPVSAGIIYADFSARIVNAAWAGSWAIRNRKNLIRLPNRQGIVAAARRFREYPLISTPGGLINALGGTLTPLMIYGTFSAATAGQYSLVDRSVALPVALIITATSQVYSAQLAGEVRAGGLGARTHFRALVRWLALICVGPVVLGALLAPMLFAFAFGPGWERAGHFAQFMIPAYGFILVAGGVNMALIIIGDQRTQICWEIGRLVAMIVLWASIPKLGWTIETIVAAHAVVIGASALVFLLIADWRLGLFEHRGRANRDGDERREIWQGD